MIAKELISQDYVKVDQNEHISKLIGKLKLKKEKAAVVFDDKRFVGISTKRLLIKTKQDPAEMKVKRVIAKVPVLKGDETIPKTAKLMYTADSHILPVIEKGVFLGVIKLISLIDLIKKNKKLSNIKASKVMSTKTLITVNENDRLGKAIEIFKENKIDRIPIVDKKGELINIASMTDIMFNFILQQQRKTEARGIGRNKTKTRAFRDRIEADAFPIKNFATPIIIDAKPEDSVSKIIDLMKEFEISSIVLIKDKKPVGIITERNLLKLLIKAVTF